MKCFNQISQSAGYKEDMTSVSLTVCGGSYGGGSEVLVVAYGLISKGNGEVILTEEKHTSLTSGGGQAGQGYPCVMVANEMQRVSGTLNPGGHPGSYNGQDAYNDLLVVDDGFGDGNRPSERRNYEGGVSYIESRK